MTKHLISDKELLSVYRSERNRLGRLSCRTRGRQRYEHLGALRSIVERTDKAIHELGAARAKREWEAERAGWAAYWANPLDTRQCKYRPDGDLYRSESVTWDQAWDAARRYDLVGLTAKHEFDGASFDRALERLVLELGDARTLFWQLVAQVNGGRLPPVPSFASRARDVLALRRHR